MSGVAITSRYIWDSDYQIQIQTQIQTQEKAEIQTQMKISNE